MTNQIEACDLTARSYCSIFQVESWEGLCQHDCAANFFVEGDGGKEISHLEGFPVSLSFFKLNLILFLNLSFCLLFLLIFSKKK